MDRSEWIKTLREVVKYGEDYPFSPDNPPCPDCGHEMQFFGHDENGDFPEGEGYWQCPSCRFRFYEYNL
jgi:tRNA(Ile2) C34 agmatinyltransferase TiaS